MGDVFEWLQLFFEELDWMFGRRVRASIASAKRIAVYPAIALLIAAFMDWWWLAAIATGYAAYQTMRLSLVLAPGAIPLFSIGENTASNATKQWFRGALAVVLGECLVGLAVTWFSIWEDPRAFGVALIASTLLAVHSFVWQSTGKWGQRSIKTFAILALISSVLAFVEPDIRKATRDAHGKWGKEKAEEIRKDGFVKAFTPAWPGKVLTFILESQKEKAKKTSDEAGDDTTTPPTTTAPSQPEKRYGAEPAIPVIRIPCTQRGGEYSVQDAYDDGHRVVDVVLDGETGCTATVQHPSENSPNARLEYSFHFNWRVRGPKPVRTTLTYERSGTEFGPFIEMPETNHETPPGGVSKARFEKLSDEAVTIRFRF